MLKHKLIKKDPLKFGVSAISCGIVAKKVLLDLDYFEDSNAEADANFVFNSEGKIIEIQCTGEKDPVVTYNFLKCSKPRRILV